MSEIELAAEEAEFTKKSSSISPSRDFEKTLSLAAFQAQFKFAQGKILTIIDAVFFEKEQKKAVKDLINRVISEQLNHVDSLVYGNTGAKYSTQEANTSK